MGLWVRGGSEADLMGATWLGTKPEARPLIKGTSPDQRHVPWRDMWVGIVTATTVGPF